MGTQVNRVRLSARLQKICKTPEGSQPHKITKVITQLKELQGNSYIPYMAGKEIKSQEEL